MTIRLSHKHGVNPSVQNCFICGETKGLILFGKLKDDQAAPREVCTDTEPCDKCKEYMKQGIIFISVRDGESGDNPYRTGKFCVLKEEAAKRVIIDDGTLLGHILSKRMAFVPDEAWEVLGLPS